MHFLSLIGWDHADAALTVNSSALTLKSISQQDNCFYPSSDLAAAAAAQKREHMRQETIEVEDNLVTHCHPFTIQTS